MAAPGSKYTDVHFYGPFSKLYPETNISNTNFYINTAKLPSKAPHFNSGYVDANKIFIPSSKKYSCNANNYFRPGGSSIASDFFPGDDPELQWYLGYYQGKKLVNWKLPGANIDPGRGITKIGKQGTGYLGDDRFWSMVPTEEFAKSILDQGFINDFQRQKEGSGNAKDKIYWTESSINHFNDERCFLNYHDDYVHILRTDEAIEVQHYSSNTYWYSTFWHKDYFPEGVVPYILGFILVGAGGYGNSAGGGGGCTVFGFLNFEACPYGFYSKWAPLGSQPNKSRFASEIDPLNSSGKPEYSRWIEAGSGQNSSGKNPGAGGVFRQGGVNTLSSGIYVETYFNGDRGRRVGEYYSVSSSTRSIGMMGGHQGFYMPYTPQNSWENDIVSTGMYRNYPIGGNSFYAGQPCYGAGYSMPDVLVGSGGGSGNGTKGLGGGLCLFYSTKHLEPPQISSKYDNSVVFHNRNNCTVRLNLDGVTNGSYNIRSGASYQYTAPRSGTLRAWFSQEKCMNSSNVTLSFTVVRKKLDIPTIFIIDTSGSIYFDNPNDVTVTASLSGDVQQYQISISPGGRNWADLTGPGYVEVYYHAPGYDSSDTVYIDTNYGWEATTTDEYTGEVIS